MTKDEIRNGLLQGRTLCQEEWADKHEIKIVDELLSEGIAETEGWQYSDNFQCERRYIRALNRQEQSDAQV